MSTSQFEALFKIYLNQAKQAQGENKHHDFRRGLFLEFLHDAFNIDQAEIEIERYIQIAGKQIPVQGIARVAKGWIDAVFRDLIFEFKRDLKIEGAEGK